MILDKEYPYRFILSGALTALLLGVLLYGIQSAPPSLRSWLLRDWDDVIFVGSVLFVSLIWLARAPWRGAAVRWILILQSATGIASIVPDLINYKMLAARFVPHERLVLSVLIISAAMGTLLGCFVCFSVYRRKAWTRSLFLGLSVVAVVLTFATGLRDGLTPQDVRLTACPILFWYWLAHPDVKREFIVSRPENA